MQTQKEPTWLFLLFVQQTQDSSLAWIILIRIHGKCMYNTSDRDSFHGQGHCDIVAFPANIFRQYLKRYLKMCHWLLKQVFPRTGFFFFLLIPRYGCVGVIYVSKLMVLHFSPWKILFVYYRVEFFRTIFKV